MGCDTVCDHTIPEGALTMLALVGWIGIALITAWLALMMVAWAMAWSHSRSHDNVSRRRDGG